jgi:dihydrofolate synthase/folylpolyglutamate synthase
LTYEQTLDYLFAKLPMYQRIGAVAYKKDLTNIIKLCDALGNPNHSFKSIHIAGTNGKGSTSHILSAIYQANGYKVGLYTSPHLVDFRERIKLNGAVCSKEFVVSFTQRIAPLIEAIQPSFFEITVAMAFAYFAEQKVDVAIIETGLGGRLDSTNIIQPLACIITSIGYDHMDMLGNTLELIAGEKAGIIKENVPVVLGNISESPRQVLIETAQRKNAPLHSYLVSNYKTDLKCDFQNWNIGCAMQVVQLLQKELKTDSDKTNYALNHVQELTKLAGRWQQLNDKPLVVCDVGHNEEGFRHLAEQLRAVKKPIHFLLGFVSDKDLDKIIPLIPEGKSFHFIKPAVMRGMDAEIAQQKFAAFGIQGKAHPSAAEAITHIKGELADSEMLFIGGSNFVVADVLLLASEEKLPWK